MSPRISSNRVRRPARPMRHRELRESRRRRSIGASRRARFGSVARAADKMAAASARPARTRQAVQQAGASVVPVIRRKRRRESAVGGFVRQCGSLRLCCTCCTPGWAVVCRCRTVQPSRHGAFAPGQGEAPPRRPRTDGCPGAARCGFGSLPRPPARGGLEDERKVFRPDQ